MGKSAFCADKDVRLTEAAEPVTGVAVKDGLKRGGLVRSRLFSLI